MKLIPLTKGKFAKVDDEDFEHLMEFKWHLTSAGGYAGRNNRPKWKPRILMHRFILGAREGQEVDHVSGDRLDNRRSNLRIANKQQNGFNRGLNRNNTSGSKGVCWSKAARKWRAYIYINGKQIHLGLFDDKNEAISVYMSTAPKYHGEFFHV